MSVMIKYVIYENDKKKCSFDIYVLDEV